VSMPLAGREHRVTLTAAAELAEAAYWHCEHRDGLPYVALGSWLRSVARRHRCAPGESCAGCASPWPCPDLLAARWMADTLLGALPALSLTRQSENGRMENWT